MRSLMSCWNNQRRRLQGCTSPQKLRSDEQIYVTLQAVLETGQRQPRAGMDSPLCLIQPPSSGFLCCIQSCMPSVHLIWRGSACKACACLLDLLCDPWAIVVKEQGHDTDIGMLRHHCKLIKAPVGGAKAGGQYRKTNAARLDGSFGSWPAALPRFETPFIQKYTKSVLLKAGIQEADKRVFVISSSDSVPATMTQEDIPGGWENAWTMAQGNLAT